MVMSTGEKRKKSERKKYKSPLPIPCTLKELDVLLNKWIADGVLNPIMFLKSPLKKNREIHVSTTYVIMCSTLI